MESTQDRICREPEILEISNLSASAIRRAIERGEFPPPIKLVGRRAKGWRLSDIQRWLANLEPANVLQPANPGLAQGSPLTQPEDQQQGPQLTQPEGPEQGPRLTQLEGQPQ